MVVLERNGSVTVNGVTLPGMWFADGPDRVFYEDTRAMTTPAMTPEKLLDCLEATFGETTARIETLQKENDAAPGWGAAVSARCEEIRSLKRGLCGA